MTSVSVRFGSPQGWNAMGPSEAHGSSLRSTQPLSGSLQWDLCKSMCCQLHLSVLKGDSCPLLPFLSEPPGLPLQLVSVLKFLFHRNLLPFAWPQLCSRARACESSDGAALPVAVPGPVQGDRAQVGRRGEPRCWDMPSRCPGAHASGCAQLPCRLPSSQCSSLSLLQFILRL